MKMKLLRKKIGALKGVAVAGLLASSSAGDCLGAIVINVDMGTSTITASGSISGLIDVDGIRFGANYIYDWGDLGQSSYDGLDLLPLFDLSPHEDDGVLWSAEVGFMYGGDSEGLEIAVWGNNGAYDGVPYVLDTTTESVSFAGLPESEKTILAGVDGWVLNEVSLGSGRFVAPSDISFSVTPALAAVPEPSSTALLGLGGLALMLRRRR